jgi:chromosome partitioning protein
MRVWAVANQKGGVGKTTTTVTLGGLLSERGLRTLLVDLDPHGSMTAYFGHEPEAVDHSAYSLFQQAASGARVDAAELIRSTDFEGLDLLCSSTGLATVERQAGAQAGMGLVLQGALQGLAGRYEHVLIDCPPALGVLMINALAACEHLLIPVQTEFLALKGLERMRRSLEMIQRSRGSVLSYTVVPTMFDRRTRASIQSLRRLREEYAEGLWHSVIPIDTQFREASNAGRPLSIMNRRARGSIAFAELLDTLLARELREPARAVS